MTKIKAEAQIGEATRHLERELGDARAERDRMRTRLEALEAIVTDDGFDLARDARRAGLDARLDLDALPDPLPATPAASRTRTR